MSSHDGGNSQHYCDPFKIYLCSYLFWRFINGLYTVAIKNDPSVNRQWWMFGALESIIGEMGATRTKNVFAHVAMVTSGIVTKIILHEVPKLIILTAHQNYKIEDGVILLKNSFDFIFEKVVSFDPALGQVGCHTGSTGCCQFMNDILESE